MQKPTSQRARELLAAVFVMVLIISTIVSAIYYYFFLNYAEIEARTIEQALVEGGAVKKCDDSAAGRGPDNDKPWYDATFELRGNTEDVVALIREVATKNGYNNLNEEEPNYLGYRHFADRSSKKSFYPDFDNGNSELGYTVYRDVIIDKEGNLCGLKRVDPKDAPKDSVIFNLGVDLPRATK